MRLGDEQVGSRRVPGTGGGWHVCLQPSLPDSVHLDKALDPVLPHVRDAIIPPTLGVTVRVTGGNVVPGPG